MRQVQNGILMQVVFEKVYTRDTCLIIQQAWANSLTKGMEKQIGLKNPHVPVIIYYLNDGIIEIWENKRSTQWIMAALLSKNNADQNFLQSIIEDYTAGLNEIESFWKNGALKYIQALENFVEKVFEVMVGFSIIYYSGLDERTPTSIRRTAFGIRDKDIFFDETDKLIRKSLRAIYPQLEENEQAILTEEISNPPNISVLSQRKKNFVIVPNIAFEPMELKDFAKANPQYKFLFEESGTKNNITQVEGQVAFKGVVTGRVHIVMKKEQISEVKEGEILVSPMTTPDFTIAMEKAAAIITDEGGILCHAAILSRELGKPCIVGTKTATKAFKNGDLVEVDANKGIVKRLD